jgi:hypothetical protein
MNAGDNPYAFGIAPLKDPPRQKSEAINTLAQQKVRWTLADVIMICVSGAAQLPYLVVSGLFFLIVMDDSPLSALGNIALSGLLATFVVGLVAPFAAMLFACRSIRRWKTQRMQRTPGNVMITVEGAEFDNLP